MFGWIWRKPAAAWLERLALDVDDIVAGKLRQPAPPLDAQERVTGATFALTLRWAASEMRKGNNPWNK